MTKTKRWRIRFTLAGLLVGVFFLCVTISLWRLAFFMPESQCFLIVASIPSTGAMIGALLGNHQGVSALDGATLGALLSPLVTVVVVMLGLPICLVVILIWRVFVSL